MNIKHIIRFGALAVAFAGLAFGSACTKEEQKPTGPGSSDADFPFTEIFLTSEGERVQGVLDETKKNVAFAFENAASFSACKVEVKLNDGWTCIYPEDLDNADFSSEPVFMFRSPSNKTSKIFVKITSNSAIITNPDNVKLIEPTIGTVMVSDEKKTIKIVFSPDNISVIKNLGPTAYDNKTGMDDLLTIRLNFDGALREGATLKNEAVFDFYTSRKPKTLSIIYGDKSIDYTVSLDMSQTLKSPTNYGFADVTEQYASADDHIEIYNSTTVTNVPCMNGDENYLAGVEGGEKWAETPFSWDIITGHETDEFGDYILDDKGKKIPIFASPYDKYYFATCGDYEADRRRESLDQINAFIIYLDPAYYKAKMYSADDCQISFSQANSFINIAAMSSNYPSAIWCDGTFQRDIIRNMADPDVDTVPDNVKEAGASATRATLGINPDGEIEFANAYYDDASNGWKKYYREVCMDGDEEYPGKTGNFTAWAVTSAATANPWPIRRGYAMGCYDLVCTDGSHYEEVFGDGWNGRRERTFVGKLFDGRIGIAVFFGTGDIENYPWFYGIGTYPASYILREMGWMDVVQVGTDYYKDEHFQPTTSVNGTVLAGSNDDIVGYILGFDKR